MSTIKMMKQEPYSYYLLSFLIMFKKKKDAKKSNTFNDVSINKSVQKMKK